MAADVVWLLGLEGVDGEICTHLTQLLTVSHVQRQAMGIVNTAATHAPSLQQKSREEVEDQGRHKVGSAHLRRIGRCG